MLITKPLFKIYWLQKKLFFIFKTHFPGDFSLGIVWPSFWRQVPRVWHLWSGSPWLKSSVYLGEKAFLNAFRRLLPEYCWQRKPILGVQRCFMYFSFVWTTGWQRLYKFGTYTLFLSEICPKVCVLLFDYSTAWRLNWMQCWLKVNSDI